MPLIGNNNLFSILVMSRHQMKGPSADISTQGNNNMNGEGSETERAGAGRAVVARRRQGDARAKEQRKRRHLWLGGLSIEM